MSNYDNSNRGSIWKNDKKEKDTHPDFTGSLNVDGVEYWVSAWKRKPDQSDRAPALSFSIKPKEEKPAQRLAQGAPAPSKQSSQPPADFSDDVPW